MLVLRRDEGSWTNLEISAKRLKELADKGEAVRLRFRVYDIREYFDQERNRWVQKVNLAFEDPEENFDIQRPERKINIAKELPIEEMKRENLNARHRNV